MAIVYVLAALEGVGVYYVFTHIWPVPFWAALLIADVAATVLTFLFSLIFSNASVYDPYWSVQPVVIAIGYACF